MGEDENVRDITSTRKVNDIAATRVLQTVEVDNVGTDSPKRMVNIVDRSSGHGGGAVTVKVTVKNN